MKSRALKLISLLLVMAVIATCCVIAGVSASAASGDVVYFDNSVTKFGTPYCYMWSDGSGENSGWPGAAMTNVSGDIWSYNITGDFAKVIFNGGQGAAQSADLDYAGNGKLATPSGGGDKFTVSWSDYSGGGGGNPTPQPSENSNPSSSAGVIYCQNDANWSEVWCYMWNSESDKNAGWPGVKMTSIGDGVFEYSYSKNFANVIFSQNGQNQTPDINNWASKGTLYNNKTQAWETYSSSPVKITSFTSSVESPTYTNCSVRLSAVAKSSESSSLTYKFSAGSTVLSDGTASSVTWIPSAAGTIKLSVEVKDGAGNSNTRSMNFEVKSADNLAEAYISGFTNSLGTYSQIKRGSALTFTTSAIGGKVGTNLLFYKFQITDPDGNNNTAYYTTGKTYSYTPTKLGTYTVKASVQNSYNATVTNTYTYTSVDTINEDPDAPNPPTPSNPNPPSGGSLKGDANNDSKVDVNDVTWIQLYLVNIDYYKTNLNASLADVTGDNRVKIQDANKIQQYLAGIITQL